MRREHSLPSDDVLRQRNSKAPILQPSKANLESKLSSLKDPPSPVVGGAKLPFELSAIDSNIREDEQYEDASSLAATVKSQFRFWHVESLLNQAADLLDRCVQARAEYNALRERWTELQLETIEFDAYNEIHQKEIASGWYTLHAERSRAEEQAQEADKIAEEAAAKGYQLAANELYDGMARDKEVTDDRPAELAFAAAVLNTFGLPPKVDENLPGHPTDKGTVSNYAQTLARHGYAVEQRQFRSQYYALPAKSPSDPDYRGKTNAAKARADAAKHRLTAKKVEADWDEEDTEFRRERSETAVLMNELKKTAMSAPGGPYNFLDQMRPIRNQFVHDLLDAYERLVVAKDGMRDIYGYPGADQFPDINAPGDMSILDKFVLWTQDAIRYLVAFGQLDQNYILPLSLRKLLGLGDGEALSSKATKTDNGLQWVFDVPESLFPGQVIVRLRGLSAAVVESAPGVGWQVSVRPPSAAIIKQLSGISKQLDQSDVPFSRMGRVTTRESARDPDVVAVMAWHNVSPISNLEGDVAKRRWVIAVDQQSLNGTDANTLRDVQIDLQLAVRNL